jgi:hypothetical protein
MAATLIDPTKQQPQSTSAPPVASPGGATIIDPSKPAPSPTPSVTSQPGGATAIDPNQGSVAGTGSWSDFGSVASNESLMNSLPGLRTQAEAARQRLGPNWAAVADLTGSIASPTSLLNLVPGVGPELAGGAHEGFKSYMSQPDWWPSSAARTQIAKDTAFGVATAGLGHGAAELAPKLLPEAAKWVGTQAVPAGFFAHYLDNAFGKVGVDVAGSMGLFGLLNYPGTLVKRGVEKIADQPATQNAIKLLSQGSAAALQNSSPGRLWDQWDPFQ